MRISIIGSGNAGARIGRAFLGGGNYVLFNDISDKVISNLEEKGYEATSDLEYAINKTDISFVVVPTPEGENGLYDTSYLQKAAESIGVCLKNKPYYHILVLKSTVVPGTTEEIFISAIEKKSGKKEGDEFGVVYSPEFLTVIENTWTEDDRFCISPDKEGRVVLGEGENKRSGDVIEKLYRELNQDIPVLKTDYKTAELTKLIANNRLALAVSFSNEVFLFCKKLEEKGLKTDVNFAIKAVAMDPRIGEYGSVFGKAWGGPCFKKDTLALEAFFESKTGIKQGIISNSIEVNNRMTINYGVRE